MTDDQQPNIPNPPDVQDLVNKAKEIYNSLKGELEPAQNGRYIVIEVESHRHFIGDTKDEAMEMARREFPHILLFVRRIGEVEKISHHLSSFSSKKYAGLF